MTSQDITVTVGEVNVTIQLSSVATANFINSDGKFYLNGNGGDTYFKYNSTSSRVELWVGGSKVKEWGEYSGSNPFS